MRFVALFLTIFFISEAACAQTAPGAQEQSGTRSFGKATCEPAFSCNAIRSNTSGIVAAAKNCVSESFGIRAVDGLFEEVLGLDTKKCLRTKPQPKGTNGFAKTPMCCILDLGNDACKVQCNLYFVQ